VIERVFDLIKKYKEKQKKWNTGEQEKVFYASEKRKEQIQREKAFLEYDIVRSKAGIVW